MDKLAIYLTAERERVHGNLAKALALYRQALEADPQDWKVRECIADVLEAMGERRLALKELFQAAHRLIWQESYDDATRLLQKMLRIDPGKELDVTKGVQSALDEIGRAVEDRVSRALEESVVESTREILGALVDAESSTDFRVPDDILALLDRVPSPRSARRSLDLDLDGTSVRVAGREFRIGSAEDANLVIKKRGIAPRHFRILEMDGRYFVMEWDVQGVVTIDGKAADGVELTDGCVLSMGKDGPMATVRLRDATGG